MSSNIVSGEPYLCDYHRDTLEHVVCAVCPVCAGKERSELTLNAIDNYDRAEKAEAKIEEMQKILSEFIYEDQDDGSLKFSIWINELKYDFLTGKTAPYKENE